MNVLSIVLTVSIFRLVEPLPEKRDRKLRRFKRAVSNLRGETVGLFSNFIFD